MTLSHAWSELESLLMSQYGSCDFLAPGATVETIAAFEKSIGAELPIDFRQSLLIHDGQHEEDPVLLDGVDNFSLLSMQGILEHRKLVSDTRNEVLETARENDIPLEGTELPILYFPDGTYSFLNLETGNILHSVHESDFYSGGSFVSLLEAIIGALKSDQFYFNERGMMSRIMT